MKWYRCLIEGENFPGELLNKKEPIGFYATRFVEADSPEEAENIALLNLKSEEVLKLPKDLETSENTKVYFEEIEEINKSEVPEIQSGFTFYDMET